MKNKKLYLAICLIIGLIIGFIINTILVINGKYLAIDECVHNFIYRMHSEFFDKIMRFITFFGSTVFVVLFATCMFFLFIWRRKNKISYSLASTLIISTIVNNVIKVIIKRPRPEYITVVENTYSYPSGHMMASTTVYGFFIFLILRSNFPAKYKALYSILLMLLIFLVGTSRIYLGAHFFSDIFGGAIMSTAILLLFAHINDKKKWI